MSWNKYNAKTIQIQGEIFDSMAEARRWRGLQWLQRGGVIRGLSRQVKYTLIPNQYDDKGKLIERGVSYIAGFVYQDENGKLVVEDVKGYKKWPAYAVFVIKRKLMLKEYGIRVREVKRWFVLAKAAKTGTNTVTPIVNDTLPLPPSVKC